MVDITASAKAKEKEVAVGSKTARSSSKKLVQSVDPSFNMAELRELAELVNEHGFTDFEFENENIRVRLSKMIAAPAHQAYFGAPTGVEQQSSSGIAAAQAVSTEPSALPKEELFKITSPIVGTFYRSAGPDKEPYVKEGSQVSIETVVCIVEAMKLMNEIQAEVSGEVVKIYVENGQPVEYGQPLFGIRK